MQRHLRVLVLDGDARTLRRDDEAFYLEMALGRATAMTQHLPSPPSRWMRERRRSATLMRSFVQRQG